MTTVAYRYRVSLARVRAAETLVTGRESPFSVKSTRDIRHTVDPLVTLLA